MAAQKRRPADVPGEPIRADLGRPETPEERAARKAENSRRYRESKTPNNLVIALVASLAIVLFLVLVVVRPTPADSDPVDYVRIAAEAQPGVTTPLVTPVVPVGWEANRADLTPNADESFTWYIGFLTPDEQFVAIEEGIDTNAGWLPGFLGEAQPTGTIDIDGVSWDVYDQRDADDPGNFEYSLATTSGDTRFLLHGTASDDVIETLASILAPAILDSSVSAPVEG